MEQHIDDHDNDNNTDSNLGKPQPEQRYRAFLLRLWAEPNAAQGVLWRFSLEEVATGQRHGFATLEALLNFLKTVTEKFE